MNTYNDKSLKQMNVRFVFFPISFSNILFLLDNDEVKVLYVGTVFRVFNAPLN